MLYSWDCCSDTISVREFETPISVGYILRKDRKLEHAEIQAPHSKQQIQSLENIWFKKSAKKRQTNVSTL